MKILTKLLVSTVLATVYFSAALPALAGPVEDGMPRKATPHRNSLQEKPAVSSAETAKLAAAKKEKYGGNFKAAAHLYESLALAGNDIAQYEFGSMYSIGLGVVENKTMAVSWWRKSADQGNANAQFLMGSYTSQGLGSLIKSKDNAMIWYKKPAAGGHDGAQGILDRHNGIRNHRTVQPPYGTFSWYERLAKVGDNDSQYRLGIMYQEGQGVTQSDQNAFSWYRKAAEQGHAKAQDSLGLMYADGRGVTQSYQNAEKWLRKAGAQGNAGGYFHLANIFHNLGGSQNEDEALVLYGKAAALGYNEATGKITSIKRERTIWAVHKAEYDRNHPQGDGGWKAQQRAITRRINQENATKPSKAPAKVWMCQYIGNGKESCGYK